MGTGDPFGTAPDCPCAPWGAKKSSPSPCPARAAEGDFRRPKGPSKSKFKAREPKRVPASTRNAAPSEGLRVGSEVEWKRAAVGRDGGR